MRSGYFLSYSKTFQNPDIYFYIPPYKSIVNVLLQIYVPVDLMTGHGLQRFAYRCSFYLFQSTAILIPKTTLSAAYGTLVCSFITRGFNGG